MDKGKKKKNWEVGRKAKEEDGRERVDGKDKSRRRNREKKIIKLEGSKKKKKVGRGGD